MTAEGGADRRWLALRAAFPGANAAATASELARLAGNATLGTSTRAHDWAKAGRIFSVGDGVEERFPLFQLREGRPVAQAAEILEPLRPKLSDWQIAFWFTSPNAWTGEWWTPAELLATHPDRAVEAAWHEVADKAL